MAKVAALEHPRLLQTTSPAFWPARPRPAKTAVPVPQMALAGPHQSRAHSIRRPVAAEAACWLAHHRPSLQAGPEGSPGRSLLASCKRQAARLVAIPERLAYPRRAASARAEAAADRTTAEPVERVAQAVVQEAVVAEVEPEPRSAARAATARTVKLQSLFCDMNVVIIDSASKTYSGPWHWDRPDAPSSPFMEESAAIAAGYTPAPPVSPVPASVPKWAFLLVLRRMGKEAALKAAIAAYSGQNADRVRAKWEASEVIERDGATVNALGAAVGMTPEQVDQAFRDALNEAS